MCSAASVLNVETAGYLLRHIFGDLSQNRVPSFLSGLATAILRASHRPLMLPRSNKHVILIPSGGSLFFHFTLVEIFLNTGTHMIMVHSTSAAEASTGQ